MSNLPLSRFNGTEGGGNTSPLKTTAWEASVCPVVCLHFSFRQDIIKIAREARTTLTNFGIIEMTDTKVDLTSI